MTTETRKRRNYTEDFKRDAVALVTEQGYKPSEVARSLGIGDNLVRRWKREFEEEASGAQLNVLDVRQGVATAAGCLLRCFSDVSQQYLQVSTMNPRDGVEKLLKLRRENKITIELTTVGDLVECAIRHIN